MTTASLYEAWCPSCRVTHPPGTKRCLHCGGRVMPMRPPERGTFASAPPSVSVSPWQASPPDEDDAAPRPPFARPVRIGMAGIWILLAIVTAIVRHCAERG